jgi:hypothetical protein
MDKRNPPTPNEGSPDDVASDAAREQDGERKEPKEANPPHTTTGKITSPKFGSAGSGGAEFEPGPKRP